MPTNILYWLPRISSIIVSYIVYLFLTESTTYLDSGKQTLAIIMGLVLTLAILAAWFFLKKPLKSLPSLPKTSLPKLAVDLPPEVKTQLGSVSLIGKQITKFIFGSGFNIKYDVNMLLALLPLGLWFGLFWYFILGGFTKAINFPGFVFLSVVTSLPTFFSFYSWINPKLGGVGYILLGIFYTLVSISHVSIIAIVTITAFLAQTGILLMTENYRLSKPSQPIPPNPTPPAPTAPETS